MKIIRKISLVVTFIMISFCSCELLDKEFDYIQVTVDLVVYVSDVESHEYIEGESVKMLIQKDGGEKVDGVGTTGSDGKTQTTGIFKLYREQPIVASAYVVGDPDSYKEKTLTWETVDSNAGKPEKNGLRTYRWLVTISLVSN